MDNISTRKYIETNPKRQILATQLGEELLSYVNSKFEFVDYDYTKIIENSLDDIAAGKTEYLTVIQEVYDRLTAELSAFMLSNSKLCPDCGQPLRHLCKNGKDSYNYWVCTNKDNCNSKFNDNNGEPGEKRTSLALSEYLCEDCKKPLRHIIKEGPEGYNFWGCSDRSCSATYKDMNGKPGEKNIKKEKAPPSKFKCSACKSPLYHRKGHSDKTGKDYDFFVCSNKLCKITYSSEGDKPVLKGK
jgi:DNA topoisomerase-1